MPSKSWCRYLVNLSLYCIDLTPDLARVAIFYQSIFNHKIARKDYCYSAQQKVKLYFNKVRKLNCRVFCFFQHLLPLLTQRHTFALMGHGPDGSIMTLQMGKGTMNRCIAFGPNFRAKYASSLSSFRLELR